MNEQTGVWVGSCMGEWVGGWIDEWDSGKWYMEFKVLNTPILSYPSKEWSSNNKKKPLYLFLDIFIFH